MVTTNKEEKSIVRLIAECTAVADNKERENKQLSEIYRHLVRNRKVVIQVQR